MLHISYDTVVSFVCAIRDQDYIRNMKNRRLLNKFTTKQDYESWHFIVRTIDEIISDDAYNKDEFIHAKLQKEIFTLYHCMKRKKIHPVIMCDLMYAFLDSLDCTY